jgi:ABC-type branched-subunit amino acid transport system ATPase component
MEREMRYAQEMRELENLLAKAKADKDELVQESQYLQNEIERVKQEKAQTLQDRMKLEEIARATADRLRCDIRDGLSVKADLETQIYKIKRRQQEQEEENARLRTYLSKCKDDLDRAIG